MPTDKALELASVMASKRVSGKDTCGGRAALLLYVRVLEWQKKLPQALEAVQGAAGQLLPVSERQAYVAHLKVPRFLHQGLSGGMR